MKWHLAFMNFLGQCTVTDKGNEPFCFPGLFCEKNMKSTGWFSDVTDHCVSDSQVSLYSRQVIRSGATTDRPLCLPASLSVCVCVRLIQLFKAKW